MQAHPLSSTAARTSTLAAPPLATRPAASRSQGRPHALQPEPPPDSPLTPHIATAPRPYTPVAGHAGLAHDAGNLLGALHLYCDLLSLPGVLAPEHQHYAADLSLIAARSSELIRRLLQSATSPNPTGQADGDLQPESTNAEAASPAREPAAALRALAPVLQRIAAGAAHVSLNIPAPLPAVALPAEALERIAVNLVRNAAEAIRSARCGGPGSQLLTQPGQIRIALEQSGNALRLTVEDNGPGMPPAVAAAFLRPSPLPEGAVRGLGHRIVHELATATGATLSIRVRPGRGTVFSLRWPLPDGLAQHAQTQPSQTLKPLHRDGPSPHSPGGLSPC